MNEHERESLRQLNWKRVYSFLFMINLALWVIVAILSAKL